MKRFLVTLRLICALLFSVSASVAITVRGADFLYDTFTDSAGTLLSAHTPETGGAWARHTGATSTTIVISNANAARNGGGGFTNYNNPATPPSAEYDIVANVKVWTHEGFLGVGGRGTANTYDGYYWGIDGTNSPNTIKLYKGVSGTGTEIGSYSQTWSAGTTYNITLRITDAAKTVYIDGVQRINYTTANEVTGAGLVWVAVTYDTTNTTGHHLLDLRAGPITAITLENPSLTSATTSSVSLSIGTVNGGTSPYSYQWHRSTSPTFTAGGGNALSGATSATLTDSTVTPGTLYYYKCVVTDSVPNSVTSYQRAARTADVAPLVFGYIGDSLSVRETWNGNVSIADRIERILEDEYKFRSVTAVNPSVSGTFTSSWQPGGGNLIGAISDFHAANVTHVFVRLGINDAQIAVSAGTYHTNLENIVQELLGEGFVVLIAYPSWREPGYHNESNTFDDSAIPYITSYQAEIDDIVADNSGAHIGDTQTYDATARFAPVMLYDRIHFNARGTELAARNDARALKDLLGEVATGSGGQRAASY